MSAKAVREYHGKKLLARQLAALTSASPQPIQVDDRSVLITASTNLEELTQQESWLLTLTEQQSLVVKPDQLIKRRGKAGLVGLNLKWPQVQQWIQERMDQNVTVENVTGPLTHFLVEPFVPHNPSTDEYYICIFSHRDGDDILFSPNGGVDVGDVETHAQRLTIGIDETVTLEQLLEEPDSRLLKGVPPNRIDKVAHFVQALFQLFRQLHFTYLEINPLVCTDDGKLVPLDLAAKLDETAAFLCSDVWGSLDFPPPFGRLDCAEEAYIRELDSKTGASLKLTVLNPYGRIWTMVAGGGASVAYADTVSDLGYGHELANYGEYSGAPSTEATYQYATTLIQLMTRHKPPPPGPTTSSEPKLWIIGGAIANFTDVAATFQGLIQAIRARQEELKAHRVQLWVRRAGPNYQEGLRLLRECTNRAGLETHIYGPETHVTAIVPLALGLANVNEYPEFDDPATAMPAPFPRSQSTATLLTDSPVASSPKRARIGELGDDEDVKPAALKDGGHNHKPSFVPDTEFTHEADHHVENFTAKTRCVVYGLQHRAVQGMLDFDHMCRRAKPSVAALIFPFSANHLVKFYWGTDEILVPVYQTTSEALTKHPEVTVLVNFASCRSVYGSVLEALEFASQIRTIAIIAEGVPEAQTRALIHAAQAKNVGLIGPATVGGIKPGCFRIGNTGGMLDNIVLCKLYRPGSVAYVSRSGGLSNELNNLIARHRYICRVQRRLSQLYR